MLKPQKPNKSSWIYSFANEFSLEDLFGSEKQSLSQQHFPKSLPHFPGLQQCYTSWQGDSSPGEVQYLCLKSQFQTLQKLSWSTAQFHPGPCGRFASASAWVQRIWRAETLSSRDRCTSDQFHTSCRQADLENVVSISNDKTALWTILVCQSWHWFLSLPKTPSCNA